MTARRYPLAPFLQLTGWSLRQIQDVAACNGTEWRIRNERGVTEPIADRLACAAGWHPHEIWPEMLDDAIADLPDRTCVAADCTERFVPANGKQRYCSRNCRSRVWQRRRYAADDEFRRSEIDRRRRTYRENHDYELARQRRYRQTNRRSYVDYKDAAELGERNPERSGASRNHRGAGPRSGHAESAA